MTARHSQRVHKKGIHVLGLTRRRAQVDEDEAGGETCQPTSSQAVLRRISRLLPARRRVSGVRTRRPWKTSRPANTPTTLPGVIT